MSVMCGLWLPVRVTVALRVVALAGLLVAPALGAPWFCKDTQCPDFQVEEVTELYELRHYPAATWVSTSFEGVNYDEAVGRGFMELFSYIQGANAAAQKIDMTSPVCVSMLRDATGELKSIFTVSFYLPTEFQVEPPQPTSDRVFLNHATDLSVYVASYGGWANSDTVVSTAEALLNTLTSEGVDVAQDVMQACSYDAPNQTVNRHNEVWMFTT